MGVRGLQTYVEKNCPEACRSVSLKQAADNHRRDFKCRPQLVVDGMSFANQLYSKSGLEWIYGGQWLQFMQLLDDFIAKFRNISVDLVFFFDGTVCSSKREEWVKRRLTKYDTIASIFLDIKSNLKEPDPKLFQLPTSTGLLTAFALKELGAKVYQTDLEADDAIVQYAHQNEEVFGILSQDSDFMIYNTKDYYSLSHLDFNSLHTVHYDRRALAHLYLNLDVQHLPLFACLLGNHFVPFDSLRNFHRRLVGRGPIYVAVVAPPLSGLIRAHNWSGNPSDALELKRISKVVFGNYNYASVIRDGVRSYAVGIGAPLPLRTCIKVHPDFEKSMYEKHLDCRIAPYAFNLLCKLEYGSSEVLEDITAKPSALIYREIRQRCYSVLFNLTQSTYQQNPILNNGQPLNIKEWCGYHGNRMENPEIVKPLSLTKTDRVPSIYELWFSTSENEKMKVFWSILQLPMEFDLLLKVPKHLIVFSCIINFLIGGSTSGPHLKPWEVAVFVAQAVWTKNATELKQMQVPWVDAIAVNLSTLFMRGVTTVLMVLGICDYPFSISYLMPWHFYDGKLFHYLYTKAKERLSIYDLCRNQPITTQEFYKLLATVTNNTMYDMKTFDWPSIIPDFEYH